MFGVKLKDKLSCIEVNQWLGIKDVVKLVHTVMVWTCFKKG